MRRKLLRLLPVSVAVIIATMLFFQSSTGQLLAVVIRGNTQCPFGLTMGMVDNVKAFHLTAQKMKSAMKLIQKDGDQELYETPRGPFWMPAASVSLIPIVLAEQEQQLYGKGSRDVQPGDIVLDCGADIGTFTRSALNRGARTVVSIDPGFGKKESLQRNFAREIAEGRVILVTKGVWNKEDVLTIHGDTLVLGQDHGPAQQIQLTTIDKLVEELKLPRVDFIKMDIEGAEKPALNGARNTLVKFHPRISIASEHYPDDAVAIPQLVRSIVPGYQLQCGPCEFADGHVRPQAIYLF
jgi:FkbM family methyltransferase